jgi:hypothetical protein
VYLSLHVHLSTQLTWDFFLATSAVAHDVLRMQSHLPMSNNLLAGMLMNLSMVMVMLT